MQFGGVEKQAAIAAGDPDEGGDAGDEIRAGGGAAAQRCRICADSWRGRHWRRGAARYLGGPARGLVVFVEQIGGDRRGGGASIGARLAAAEVERLLDGGERLVGRVLRALGLLRVIRHFGRRLVVTQDCCRAADQVRQAASRLLTESQRGAVARTSTVKPGAAGTDLML